MEIFDTNPYLIFLLIGLAFAFAFFNALYDAADAISTVVSTRALKPYQAVLLAALCNGFAIFFFPLTVAELLALHTVEGWAADAQLVFAVLAGGLGWLILAWLVNMPVSATHSLVGALLGAALASGGSYALIAPAVIKITLFVVLTPMVAFLLGTVVSIMIAWLYVRSTPRRADKSFRRLQLLSAGLFNLAQGANNAQKCIAMIWLLMLSAGAMVTSEELPYWVVAGSYAAISVGTLFGGWRVVKTMAQRRTQLKPVNGYCAEWGATLTLLLVNNLGIPVSPRQALTGSVVGVTSSRRMTVVTWGVVTSMVNSWVLTIPAAAFAGAVAWWLAGHFM